MRSRDLEKALSDCFEEAAAHLRAEVVAGAEVAFELGAQRSRARAGATPLYCYRALTGAFIEERWPSLAKLGAHAHATKLLEGFAGLDRYLASGEAGGSGRGARGRAPAALKLLVQEVFEEQTDFELRPERVRAALSRLERAARGGAPETLVAGTLHGLTLVCAELRLSKRLTIAHPEVLPELPGQLAGALPEGGGEHLVAVYAAGEEDDSEPLTRGREALAQLLRALRLFGDGRVTLGCVGWARIAGGPWLPVALGRGGRPHGMLVVTADQEDELRAFSNLVSRRAPDDGELGWALRRFELGCERDTPLEALTDHLAALRALLEREGTASGLLPARLAALCAKPEQRPQLAARIAQALELERSVITGASFDRRPGADLAREVAEHLRALLSDLICGHLDGGLAAFADELLAEQHQEPADKQSEQPGESPAGGDTGEPRAAAGGEQDGGELPEAEGGHPDQIPLPVG